MLNWLLTLEEAVMLQTVSRFLPELPLFFMTAVATHLVTSFAQTLMHRAGLANLNRTLSGISA
jgi:hypothetical protein